MKRITTIILLLLFLLNVLGYYGVFVGIQHSFEKKLHSQFDQDDYSNEDEVLIKVPLTLPYATDAPEYSRVDGQFEHQGEVYRLVKQRYASDTLFIVCVKDNATKEINQALVDYVKSYSDNPASEKGTTKTVQSFSKDFISSVTSLQSFQNGWANVLRFETLSFTYESLTIRLISPPPQA